MDKPGIMRFAEKQYPFTTIRVLGLAVVGSVRSVSVSGRQRLGILYGKETSIVKGRKEFAKYFYGKT